MYVLHNNSTEDNTTTSENTRRISADRRTRPTLITYNTRFQLSRLQKMYRFQMVKLQFAPLHLTVVALISN